MATAVGLAIGLAIGLTFYTTPAYALGTALPDVTWNLESGNGTTSSSTYGNIRTFTASGGQILKATAFSMNTTSSALAAAYLGQYSPGLGVCNSGEFPTCSSPNHTIDNSAKIDMVIFEFAQDTYDPLQLTISAFGDTDLDYYVGGTLSGLGTVANPFSGFAGKTLAQVLATGTWSGLHNSDSAITSGTRDVALVPDAEKGRYLIVLANQADLVIAGCSSNNAPCDYFKAKTLVGEVAVPEPGTLALLGVALMGVAGWYGGRGRLRKK